MCVHPKGTYANLTENSQDFIFLLLSKTFSVCLLGAHTKKLSQWELDTLYMFIISWSQLYTWSVSKVIPWRMKRSKGIYGLFSSYQKRIFCRTLIYASEMKKKPINTLGLFHRSRNNFLYRPGIRLWSGYDKHI